MSLRTYELIMTVKNTTFLVFITAIIGLVFVAEVKKLWTDLRQIFKVNRQNTAGVGKLAIFVRFSTDIAVYLGNGAR